MSTVILVTRGRIELPFAAWEAAVLAAWPTGHNSKTFGLCFVKEFSVRPFQTSHRSFLVHHHGLEPWTHWLRVSCSTNWANGAYFLVNKKVCKENFTERFRTIPSWFTRIILVSSLSSEQIHSKLYTLHSYFEGFTPSKLNNHYSHSLFFSRLPNFLGQALGLLVSVRSIHYCTSTPDLSTL